MIMCCFKFACDAVYILIYFVKTDLLTSLIFFIWHFKLLIVTFWELEDIVWAAPPDARQDEEAEEAGVEEPQVEAERRRQQHQEHVDPLTHHEDYLGLGVIRGVLLS